MESQVVVSKPYTLVAGSQHHGYFASVQSALGHARDKKHELQEIYGNEYSFPIVVYRESANGPSEMVHEE